MAGAAGDTLGLLAERQEVSKPLLWAFIRGQLWLSLATYAGVLVLAGARDVLRSQLARKGGGGALNRVRSAINAVNRDKRGFFFYVELARFLSNVFMCAMYVFSTYQRRVSLYMTWVNRAFALAFALELALGAALSSSAWRYLLSPARFIQVFSLPSLFLAAGPNAFLNFGFLRAFPAYDSYLKLEPRLVLLSFMPKKLVLRLGAQFITLFFVLAGGIQMLEIPGNVLNPSFSKTWEDYFGKWSFFNCVYFVVVTLSTVGYGDFYPVTFQGHIYTIFMIIVGVYAFGSIAKSISDEMRRPRGDGSYEDRTGVDHIILSGTPNLDELVHFVNEFFADTGRVNDKCDIVVLVEDPKWTDKEWDERVSTNSFLRKHVFYLVGKVKEEDDLSRAGIKSAKAVFILTSAASSDDPLRQDSQTIMSVLAIRDVRSDIPILSQILLEQSRAQIKVAMRMDRSRNGASNSSFPSRNAVAANLGDQRISSRSALERSNFVCLQQLHTSLLVANIMANGAGTLCTNMYLDIPAPRYLHDIPPWLQEYHLGAACSLVHADIPEELNGALVKTVTSLLVRRGGVLIATQERSAAVWKPVLDTFNPLRGGQVGMFLTYLNVTDLENVLKHVAQEYQNLEFALHSTTPASHGDNVFNSQLLQPADGLGVDGAHSWWDVPAINEHVIVAVDGKGSLENLRFFLSFLRKRYEEIATEEPHVVVIYSEDVPEHSSMFQIFDRNLLHFVKGPLGARYSWEQASLESARSVVMIADYAKSAEEADGRTTYTLLTLDEETKTNRNVFICSELMDKASLRFLSEPQLEGRLARSYRSLAKLPFGQIGGDNDGPSGNPQEVSVAATTAHASVVNQQELFGNFRYASGELLIRSTTDTLLVREYMQPGFIELITEVCGAIRLVGIPKSLFQGQNRENNPLRIDYEVVFKRLVDLGVLPLGLYRSGDALVSVPKERRSLSRGEIQSSSVGSRPANESGIEFVEVPQNSLPYVYTLPNINTQLAETDAVYIMCEAGKELPRDWPSVE